MFLKLFFIANAGSVFGLFSPEILKNNEYPLADASKFFMIFCNFLGFLARRGFSPYSMLIRGNYFKRSGYFNNDDSFYST